MFYRKIDKSYGGNLSAQDLSYNIVDEDELQQDYDTAIQSLVSISPGHTVDGNNFEQVVEGCWEYQTNVMIDRLHSCAAVLFYNENFQLIAAYHAPGGTIEISDPNTPAPDEVSFVIYATPQLPKNGDTGYTFYKEAIDNLATKYNTQKICIIDGFSIGGAVMANCVGQLSFC